MEPSLRSVLAAFAAALVLLAVTSGCRRTAVTSGPTPLVFAAASLSDALTEVGKEFEVETGQRVSFNFAGSSTLARQIAAGAPADLFVSADRAQMEMLERGGKVAAESTVELLGNQLVVAVPASKGGSIATPEGLLDFGHLALADPEAGVPAGVYARAWLEHEGLWEKLRLRVVPTLDVRAALAAVAAGHVPAAVVYSTDAATTDRVRVAYRVPPGEAPRIAYFAAPVAGRGSPAVAAFLTYLRGPAAGEVFRRFGFTLPTPPAAEGVGR